MDNREYLICNPSPDSEYKRFVRQLHNRNTHALACVHTRSCTYTRTFTGTDKLTRRALHDPTHTRTKYTTYIDYKQRGHTSILTRVHAHTYIHTYIHKYTHTYTHTCTHIHTPTWYALSTHTPTRSYRYAYTMTSVQCTAVYDVQCTIVYDL